MRWRRKQRRPDPGSRSFRGLCIATTIIVGACAGDPKTPGGTSRDSTDALRADGVPGADGGPGWSDLATRVTGRRTFLAFRTVRIDSALAGCDGSGPCARVSLGLTTFPEAEPVLGDALHRQVADLMDLRPESDVGFEAGPARESESTPPQEEGSTDAARLESMAAAAAHSFLEMFRSFSRDFPDSPGEWFLERTLGVEAASPDLLALGMEERTYAGGAHPNSRVRYRTLDPETGSVLSLSDLLRPGFEDRLRSEGERAFRQAHGLGPGVDLAEAGFFESAGGRFELNDNFAPKGDGLAFHFDAYEIAAYAAGPTDLIIPWSEIPDLIPIDGPLTDFVGSITRSPGEPQ